MLEVRKSDRGFEYLVARHRDDDGGEDRPLVTQSSAVDCRLASPHPGTSYLWVGREHHLSRAKVLQLIVHLQAWLATGSLVIATPGVEGAKGEGVVRAAEVR